MNIDDDRVNPLTVGAITFGPIDPDRTVYGSGLPFELPNPTRPAPPMPEIKQPIGLRPKYIAYSERLKEIHAAIGRYLDAGKVIPQEWIDEFSILNSEL